jgi:ElaB/YqjD/DUF883 family membrane-anchored ribosome-binding protein
MSKLWDEIKRISDEVEQAIETASHDAKSKWQTLKPRVSALGTKMEDTAAAASARVVEELTNVGTLVKELRDDVVKRVKK